MAKSLTRVCTKCNEEKSLKTAFWKRKNGSRFYTHCKMCKRIASREGDKAYQKRKRAADPKKKIKETREYERKHPEILSAYRKVNAAIFSGKLKKQPCVKCGIEPAHAHHEDYSKPLEVIWLCPSDHKKRHLGQITLREIKK